ncbi:MAG: hypothetical protein LBR37_02990 [Erysipelotrichaceae bacterium]|jgi:hypothetical protein|nr:hypothetical protein [Erysipelotrichaceae bacterium]
MINVFLALMFGVFSYEFFLISSNYSVVNRSFMRLAAGIMENNVYIDEESDEVLFDVKKVKESVNAYLLKAIDDYGTKIEIGFYFYNNEDDFCFEEHCSNVIINLKCKISYFVKYDKLQRFELVHNE